jgi:hypothetical protein
MKIVPIGARCRGLFSPFELSRAQRLRDDSLHLGLRMSGASDSLGFHDVSVKTAVRVLHTDHLLGCMQRLNTYEAKTNAMTIIGSNLSQVLPLPFSCE